MCRACIDTHGVRVFYYYIFKKTKAPDSLIDKNNFFYVRNAVVGCDFCLMRCNGLESVICMTRRRECSCVSFVPLSVFCSMGRNDSSWLSRERVVCLFRI